MNREYTFVCWAELQGKHGLSYTGFYECEGILYYTSLKYPTWSWLNKVSPEFLEKMTEYKVNKWLPEQKSLARRWLVAWELLK